MTNDENDLPALRQQLRDMRARVAWLEVQLQAQQRLHLAATLAQPTGQRLDYFDLAVALQLQAAAQHEWPTAKAMGFPLQEWQALCGALLQADLKALLVAIRSNSILAASTPQHLQAALQHWLAGADHQEILQELAPLLRPAPGDGDAPQKRPKKSGDDDA